MNDSLAVATRTIFAATARSWVLMSLPIARA